MKTSSIIAALAYASSVWAHGFVSKVNVGGQTFNGNVGYGSDGVVRVKSDTNPVYGAYNGDITCGPGANAPIAGLAKGNPGDEIQMTWDAGDGSCWPHNTGVSMTYMANCNGDCANFQASDAKFFKIDEKAIGSPWIQQDIMNCAPATATIPQNLAPGQYLVRHELIALHLAAEGKAEFYPVCIQLEVGGNGNGAPAADELVSFPGGYSDSDPGIAVNPYSTDPSQYQFPGPRVSSLASTSSGSNNGGNGGNGNGGYEAGPGRNSTSTPSSYDPAETGDNASFDGSNESCKLKKVKRTAHFGGVTFTPQKREDALNRPRHISRIMRGLSVPASV